MLETEIKLAVEDLDALRARLRELGWRPAAARALERNTVYDTPERTLFAAGKLLRVRESRGRVILTVKLPVVDDSRHKVREEHEASGAAAALHGIAAGLGFEPAWRYEKYRTRWLREGAAGVIELDETPIGNFIELEGEAEWIDRTAAALGYDPAQAITADYRTLFVEWRRRTGRRDEHMEFPSPAGGSEPGGEEPRPSRQ